MQNTTNKLKINPVMSAYADCWMDNIKALSIRDLQFRSENWVTPIQASKLMKLAVPEGYNNFKAELIPLLPPDCRIQIAREYSVCLYVKTGALPLPSQDDLLADNYSVDADGFLRIWWD